MAIQLNHRNNTITTGSNAETAGINLDINNTGSLRIPRGTTAQRPASPLVGMIRFNTDLNSYEFYNGTSWVSVLLSNIEDLKDANGELILDGISVGSNAENYVTITNASAGANPVIAVNGSDININLTVLGKGTGTVDVNNTVIVGEGSAQSLSITSENTSIRVVSTEDLNLEGSNVNVVLSSVTDSFRVKQGSTNALTVVASGSNGLTVEAGGTEARLRSDSGSLFIESTGTGNVRVGNNLITGLIVNTQVSGNPLIIKTEGTGPVITSQSVITINSSAAEVSFSNSRLSNVANPTQPQDAVTKAYVDAAITGLDWKKSVRVATDSSIELSGLFTIDTVALSSGDRVLVKNQVSAERNGIYEARLGTWVRATDADENVEVTPGLAVFVEEGLNYGDTGWVLTTNSAITLDSTGLTFVQFTGAASFSLVGGLGIKTNLVGTTWTIEADVDNSTIWASGAGDRLAVFAPDAVPRYSVLVAPASAGAAGRSAVWGQVNLASPNAVTGVLDVFNGGTGINSVANQALLVGTGGSALSTLAVGAASTTDTGTVLTVNNAGNVAWGNLTLNQLSNVTVSGAVTGDILRFNGTEWVAASAALTDRQVAVSAGTTPGYLSDVLVAATSGAVNLTSVGNTMQVAVRYDDNTIIAVGNNLAVGDGLVNQVLVGNGTNTAATWQYLNTLYNLSGEALFNVTGNNINSLTFNGTTGELSMTGGSNDFKIVTASGNVYLNSIRFPNSSMPARSVLVTNLISNELTFVTASAENYRILRWNNTAGNFEFVAQDQIASETFSKISINGSVILSADSVNDTLNVESGVAVIVSGDAVTDTLRINFGKNNITEAAVVGSSEVVFFDVSGNPHYRKLYSALDDVNVPRDVTSNGLVTRLASGSYSARSIVANVSADKLGISVINGDGVAGNPTIGLNIISLTTAASVLANDQYLIVYNSATKANERVKIADVVGGTVDTTRIKDGLNTTYVDTDEIAGKVVIAASGQYVATFDGGALATSAQYFNFDSSTSAGVLRLQAQGTTSDISIRLIPAGTGQVLIGDVGDGIIQSEDGFDLILRAGLSGNVMLQPGANDGVLRIYTGTSALLQEYKRDNSVTHYASDVNSFATDHVVRITTNNNIQDYEFTTVSGATILFEGYVVARRVTDNTNGGGYKVKGVAYNNGTSVTLMDTVVQEVIAELPSGLDATFVTSAAKLILRVNGATGVGAVNWTSFVKFVNVV